MPTETALDPRQWVDRHGDALFCYAYGRVGARDVAEDLVQETLLAGLSARHTYEQRASERTWLFAILKRRLADWYRRKHPSAQTAEESIDRQFESRFKPNGKWLHAPEAWTVNPAALCEQAEFRQQLRRCLDNLPPRLLSAVTLREIDGLAAAEVCNLIDVTANNLWTLLHRARVRLRDCLDK